MENLTKENFWDQLMEKYPEEMKRFCSWIDGYKERTDWKRLFNTGTDYTGYIGIPGKPVTEFKKVREAPKYHDLPIAMQFGIFLQFAKESWVDKQIDGERAFREQSMNFITSWFIRKNRLTEISEPFQPKE